MCQSNWVDTCGNGPSAILAQPAFENAANSGIDRISCELLLKFVWILLCALEMLRRVVDTWFFPGTGSYRRGACLQVVLDEQVIFADVMTSPLGDHAGQNGFVHDVARCIL